MSRFVCAGEGSSRASTSARPLEQRALPVVVGSCADRTLFGIAAASGLPARSTTRATQRDHGQFIAPRSRQSTMVAPTKRHPAAGAAQPRVAAPRAAAAAAPQHPAHRASLASAAAAFRRGTAPLAAARRATPAARRRGAAPPAAAAATEPGSKGAVAVTGATGLIGTRLVEALLAQGYTVRALTRSPAAAAAKLPRRGVEAVPPARWAEALRGAAAVVNLAGEPIATRWTPELKAEIKRSRVATTTRLADAINALPPAERPRSLVSASAVGYYGNSETATYSESSPAGGDYLAEVCRAWEAAAERAETRVVTLRTGIVLAREGGALGKMVPVFQIFAGGPLGSGRQWCSWIHRDDFVGMVLAAIEDDAWRGAYNATAPNPVRMGELCSALGAALGRPSFVPVPDFALRTLLGEGAGVVLDGQRVLPARAQGAGFRFRHESVEAALRDLWRK
jgi:uncharacterized protein (TIGR01777 family)